LTVYVERQLSLPPLQIVAKACLLLNLPDTTARTIFESYDRFLAILDDRDKRDELEHTQSHKELRESKTWAEVRKVSQPFHEALTSLFLKDDERLTDLTMKYGVF